MCKLQDLRHFLTRHHTVQTYVFNKSLENTIRIAFVLLHPVKSDLQSNITLLQKKLENELTQIQEKHDDKKRKFTEASEEFHREHKKVKAT